MRDFQRPPGSRSPRTSTVYRGVSFTVTDWECHPSSAGPSSVEASEGSDLVFIRGGVFCRHLGGSTTVADPNSVLFFNPHEEYRVTHPQCLGDRCTIITIAETALAEVLVSVGLAHRANCSRPFGVDHGHVPTDIAVALRRLTSRMRSREPLAMDEILHTVVYRALACQRKEDAVEPRVPRQQQCAAVQRVKEIAATRFSEVLSLELFSRETGYSPFHLLRTFREHTGMTVWRYVLRLRLLHALERLDSEASLSRLALDLGFSSHAHFTTAFTAEFGAPPSRIRQGKPASASYRNRGASRRGTAVDLGTPRTTYRQKRVRSRTINRTEGERR
jgi:AraC family transcriptional regulator